MNHISDRLGAVIRAARNEKHLTQRELAERLSITSRYLMSIENRKQIPSCELLFRIVRELEIHSDVIFYPENTHRGDANEKLKLLLRQSGETEAYILLATLRALLDSKLTDGR